MARVLSAARYVVILGVIACALGALLLFVGALAQLVLVAATFFTGLGTSKEIKALAVNEIFLADITLIATALFLVAVGLYELFISKIDLPVGVTVVSLDDLKDKLMGVIIVALAVSFLAQIAVWDGKTDLLSYGGSIALVILALGAFTYLRRAKGGGDHDDQHRDGTQT
jgi:uncharacterized membrane protein YqhA